MHDRGELNSARSPQPGESVGGGLWVWAGLGLAMAIAAVVILRAGRGLTFGADEFIYFGRLVEGDGEPVVHGLGFEYLLAPHNGHLQVGGKLLYEASFGLFGAARAPLQIAALAGIFASIGLFLALAKRRVGPWPALAVAVALLFMGAAWEVMLWPFDAHTTYALAFGLAALIALERADRPGDLVAAGFLVASLAMIEVALAFLAAAAILIAFGRKPLRRAWVVGVPLVLYAAWWLWAQRFDHDDLELSRIGDLPASAAESMTAVVAAVTGLYAHGAGVWPSTLDPEPAAAVIAAIATVALAVGLLRARRSPRASALLGALAVYWTLIALADRPPDSSRYTWVGAILLALIAAEVLAGWATRRRHGAAAAAAIAVVFVLSLPVGLDKLSDGREASLAASDATRVEFAMLELVGPRADPDFNPSARLFASAGLPAGAYLRARDRIGSLGASLEEVRELAPALRFHADEVLGTAYELVAEPVRRSRLDGCRRAGASPLELAPSGAAFIAGPGNGELALGRFADAGAFPLGRLTARKPVVVRIPVDAAADPWRSFAPPGTRVCDVYPRPAGTSRK